MTKEEFIEKYIELCKEAGYYVGGYGFEVDGNCVRTLSNYADGKKTLENHRKDLLDT